MTNHTTYWASNGKYQTAVDMLTSMLPADGEVPNKLQHPKLEKFRKAVNLYYDLYNNGLWNHTPADFRSVFSGLNPNAFKVKKGANSHRAVFFKLVEVLMDDIIEDAVLEQAARIAEIRASATNLLAQHN